MTMVPVTVSALCHKRTLALGPTRFGRAHCGELGTFTLLEELFHGNQSIDLLIVRPAATRIRPCSVTIRLAGNKTSISLENQFWNRLGRSLAAKISRWMPLIERIDTEHTGTTFICGSIVCARLCPNAYQSRHL